MTDEIEKIIAEHLVNAWELETLHDGTPLFSDDEILAGEYYSDLIYFDGSEEKGVFYYFVKVENDVSFYLRQDSFEKERMEYSKNPCHKELITFIYGKNYDNEYDKECFISHVNSILDVISTSFKGYLLNNITKLKLIPLSTDKFG